MTQSSPQPPEPSAELPAELPADKAETTTAGTAPGRRARLVRLTRQGRARWVALGLVVVVGGGAAAVAVAEHHHHDKRAAAAFAGGPHGHGFGPGRPGMGEPEGGEDGAPGKHDRMRQGREFFGPGRPGAGFGKAGKSGQEAAPAPLPELPAATAVEKAAAAVQGGKVESLRVVAQQGGGSAWAAVVLGPDGVRHRVTLSADGTVTGNTASGQAPNAAH